MIQYFEKPEVEELIRAYALKNDLDFNELDNDQLMDILDELNILDPLL